MQIRSEKHHINGRRTFLQQTGCGTVGVLLSAATFNVPPVHAAEDNVLKIALIGSGNRGMGAVRQALDADPHVKLWAIADVFPEKGRNAAKRLTEDLQNRNKQHQIDLTPDRIFDGFDAYKRAMDTLLPGSVILLAAPPVFRPQHYTYAVEKGLHVFAEKPLAVDIPGLKSLRESNKIALEKGLKVAVGLNNRHYDRTAETVNALQDGKLGELFSFLVYRCHQEAGRNQRRNASPLQHQLRHIFNYNWLTGGFIVDALVHNLDICCWANQKIPTAALGMGGRLFRKDQDDMIDNSNVQYFFDDGKIMHMHTVLINNTWTGFKAAVHGAKGCAFLGEGVADPRFYSDWNGTKEFWKPKSGWNDSYQTEQNRLFGAIRRNQDWNEMGYGIDATFTGILGRIAVETGRLVQAEEVWASDFEYVPKIDELTLDGDSPFMPDSDGNYQIPQPGKATVHNPYQS